MSFAGNIPTLKFAGKTLKGAVLRPPVAAPEVQVWRTHFAGVLGESEIRGKSGGRMLEFQFLMFGSFTKRTDLFDYIEKDLHGGSGLLGTNGTIEYSGADDSTTYKLQWKDCTFEGFIRSGGELPDVAGTLDGGWFVPGMLRWRHLHTE
jgi:hypothetical protein